ncbi:ShlB/FhaC/HecB family hemolysin secretion/activation protein [Nitrogeniibacter mangrovi]|uniref:ShlB/FhaC/HecB family hemolysin secretion/activation protein n=1 Tax=Nitrogeniibacter mangrovi TaxID=2016596 RepID=A0A6C1AZP9_9RHOO|nr:ShlB/FhaC/HecB family hemolysin secretion/activation protein [Nitrogeniibacter mangrovi]QID16209.1 ShlB/FhaC/HecB family hemolysin secretion/activation protein [Nitrogeniibacter mangrovi]
MAAQAQPPAPPRGPAPFDVLEYAVEGNTVLPTRDIERAVYPHLGPGVGLDAVNAARAALEQAYHDAGYLTVTVEVPQQKVDGGLVRLQVVEGKVERLKVSGAEYTLPSKVREQMPSMAAGTVPNFNEVQEDLARLGRNPDLRINPLLRPSARPGSLEVELAMDDASPLHGSLEMNNKQSADTRRGRLEGSVRYDNLWQRRHSIGFNYFVSPEHRSDVEVWGVNYAAPIGQATLAAYFARSTSDVPTAFDTQSIGNGDTAGFRWIRPLPGLQGFFHSLSLGADYKDNAQRTELGGGFALSQPIKYWTMVAQYNAGWQRGAGAWRLGVDFAFGLDGLNRRDIDCNGVTVDQFECRRPGAEPNFSALRLNLEVTRPFGAGWLGKSRLDVQRASGPLVNTEQFSAGGADSVRGYLEGERQADDGILWRTELSTPALGQVVGRALVAFSFYDWAQLETQDPLPGQDRSALLASAGVGLRMGQGRGVQAEMAWAQVFHAGAEGPKRTRDGDGRALVRVKYEF